MFLYYFYIVLTSSSNIVSTSYKYFARIVMVGNNCYGVSGNSLSIMLLSVTVYVGILLHDFYDFGCM